MHEVKHLWDTQALSPLFGKLDAGLRPVTHPGTHRGSQGCKPLVYEGFPGRIAAICRRFFQQNISRGEVQKDQPQAFSEGFVHGAKALLALSTRSPVLLPGVPRLPNRLLQHLHRAS